MPTELDEVSRRVLQLEIEREALRKETDQASRVRLERLEKELADLKAEAAQLKARWEVEKTAIGQLRRLKEEVDEDDIAAVVSRWTGSPVARLLEGEKEKLLHLGEHLHKRLVGQDG